jgi:hypothetical protein
MDFKGVRTHQRFAGRCAVCLGRSPLTARHAARARSTHTAAARLRQEQRGRGQGRAWKLTGTGT